MVAVWDQVEEHCSSDVGGGKRSILRTFADSTGTVGRVTSNVLVGGEAPSLFDLYMVGHPTGDVLLMLPTTRT